MIIIAVIIAILIIFVLFHKIAYTFYFIAEMKGYSDKKYYWWTFWLFPIGAAMVIALPDKKNFDRLVSAIGNNSISQEITKEVADELPEL